MPIFCTPKDRLNEAEIATKLQERCGLKLLATGLLDFVDYLAEDANGKVKFLLEIKCRNYRQADVDDYHVSLKKLENGLRYSKELGVPFILMVRWNDVGAVWVHVTDEMLATIPTRRGGRWDRGVRNDVETLAIFQHAAFKPLADFAVP